jgi:hypothetical protein
MEILTRNKCSECDGCGVIYHWAWKEFNDEDEAYKKEYGHYRDMEQKDVNEWFYKKGFSKLPPEEPTCSECEGSGIIESWIDIKDLATQITPQDEK